MPEALQYFFLMLFQFVFLYCEVKQHEHPNIGKASSSVHWYKERSSNNDSRAPAADTK